MSRTRRCINFTGRKRIRQEHIDIRFAPAERGQPRQATINIDMSGWNFPINSAIVLEAYHRSNAMRFPCGTIGSPNIPQVVALDFLDSSAPILFRLKVVGVDTRPGCLLGSAERIRAVSSEDEADGQRSLFPIVSREIGEQLWKVDFTDAGPELVLNLQISDFRHTLVRDPILKGTILPAALRIVLEKLVSNPITHDVGGDSWEVDWITFCKERLNSDDLPDSSVEDVEQWILDTVDKFCCLHKFVTQSITKFEVDR